MKQCQSVVAGKQELNQSWSRELFKFVFSILLKNFSFEKNEDIEKKQTWDTFVFCKNYNVQFHLYDISSKKNLYVQNKVFISG